jgi:hypothetical protein
MAQIFPRPPTAPSAAELAHSPEARPLAVCQPTTLELAALVARLEETNAPNWDLDKALAAAFRVDEIGLRGGRVAPYTRSLDAALGLMQDLFPSWAVETCRYGRPGRARAEIWPEGLRAERSHTASCSTLPLAVLATMLKARIADDLSPGAANET